MTDAIENETGLGKPEELLPHRGSVRLVEEILSVDENELVCRARVRRKSPFSSGSTAPIVVGLEMAAQAAAVHQRLSTGHAKPPGVGYLVRIRRASLKAATLPLEEPLQVTVRLQGAAPPLFIYRLEVASGAQSLVSGGISIYAAEAAGHPGETPDEG